MIIGHGDIASVLKDKKSWIFFASGVSNSQEIREAEYQREKALLLKQNRHQHIVYFSSLSVFYPKTQYTQVRYIKHKKEMEELVKKNFSSYTIVRLGNITWGENSHTLINAIKGKVRQGESFDIPNTFRYLVDKKEFLHWIKMIPNWNCEMNIIGERLTIKEIIQKYVYNTS